MDLHIYREAMAFMANGHFLYDYVYQYVLDGQLQTLGFTYPPFAALLLLPLGSLPEVPTQVAWLAATFIEVLLLAMALVWGLHKEGRRPRPALRDPETWTVVLWFAVALLVSVPTLGHVLVGQVSLALVLLVYVDMTLVPRSWRGPLTGIAAAIKLTPLVFIGYLLLTRQWRATAQAAITFVACSALGWLVLPRESAAYWGFWLWQPSRVGNPAMEDNKSLLGLVSRAAGTGGPATVVWLVAVVVVAVVGLRHAIKLSRAGLHSSGALVAGCVALAVSPISWPHHQFWVLLYALTALAGGSRWWRIWGVAILVVFNSCLLFVTFAPDGPLAPLTDVPVLVIAACCLLGLPALRPDRGDPELPS
jgi:alpha-1,2-mannosyltransferase